MNGRDLVRVLAVRDTDPGDLVGREEDKMSNRPHDKIWGTWHDKHENLNSKIWANYLELTRELDDLYKTRREYFGNGVDNSEGWKETSSGKNENRLLVEPSSNVAMTSGMGSNMPSGIGSGMGVIMALVIFI